MDKERTANSSNASKNWLNQSKASKNRKSKKNPFSEYVSEKNDDKKIKYSQKGKIKSNTELLKEHLNNIESER